MALDAMSETKIEAELDILASRLAYNQQTVGALHHWETLIER